MFVTLFDRFILFNLNLTPNYNIVDDDKQAQKRSLRNQFNYQERASQTFNLPIREKGMKTDPPQRSVFSVESTQWMIYDAYMDQWLKQERDALEEAAKGKGKEKKPAQVV
jgi:hypothetical protein